MSSERGLSVGFLWPSEWTRIEPCIPTKFGSSWPDVVFQPRFLGRNCHDNFLNGQVADKNQVSFDTSPLFLLRDFVNTTIRRLSASLTRNSIGFEYFSTLALDVLVINVGFVRIIFVSLRLLHRIHHPASVYSWWATQPESGCNINHLIVFIILLRVMNFINLRSHLCSFSVSRPGADLERYGFAILFMLVKGMSFLYFLNVLL